MEEKRSTEGVPGGHNPPGRARQAWRALVYCSHQGTLPRSFFISKILRYSKTKKNIFTDFSGSVYIPYYVPPYFDDSGVFRKDSLMYSSGVKVWIILLSTLIGVPEI